MVNIEKTENIQMLKQMIILIKTEFVTWNNITEWKQITIIIIIIK